MTPIHRQIFEALLPICLETTRKFRAEIEQASKKEDFTELQKKTLIETNRRIGYTRDHLLFLEILTGKSLAFIYTDTSTKVYDPFTIIKLTERASNHSYPLNHPLIVINGKNFRLLNTNGKVDQSQYRHDDKPVLATDEDIEYALENLTQLQLKTILTHDLFAGIVSKLFESDTTVEVAPAKEEEEEEEEEESLKLNYNSVYEVECANKEETLRITNHILNNNLDWSSNSTQKTGEYRFILLYPKRKELGGNKMSKASDLNYLTLYPSTILSFRKIEVVDS